MKLYRFRSLKHNGVDKFCANAVDGSRFDGLSSDDLISELNLKLDVDKLVNSYNVDVEVIKKYETEVRKHLIKNWYIACFSLVDQTNDIKMWKKYASLTGYCLVYEETQLEEALRDVKEKGFAFMGEVQKSNKPVDITFIIDRIISITGTENISEEKKKYAYNHWIDTVSEEEAKKLVSIFFNKIGDYPERQELRIVIRIPDMQSVYIDDLLFAKPIEVICSSAMPSDSLSIIKKHAEANGIGFRINDCIDL